MGALDLIAKAAKGVKKSGPFFSKADVILDELQRGKGTGDEFLTELVKKGVKPTELKDRGLDKALKGKPKMTKAEVQKVFEQKAPPKVQEKVLTSEVTDYDEWLEAKAQEEYGVDYFDLGRQEKARLDKMYNDLPLTQYDKYKTPGGENYREILLKLPEAKSEREIADENLKEFTDRVTARLGRTGWDFDAMTPEELVEYDALNKASMSASQTRPLPYGSSHYRQDPNLLAHIRVQDFKTPEGKKVLLVDEIQSDWHQEGRKKGYIDPDKKPYTIEQEDGIFRVRDQNGQLFEPYLDGQRFFGFMTAEAAENAMRGNMGRLPQTYGVPDAPFKKNWHELAMKRVLDYAAENGYDTVAITPGAEQAKRYDLSKQLSRVAYREGRIQGYDPDGALVISKSVEPKDLPDFVGKELGAKMAENAQRDAEVRQAVRQAIKDDLPEDQIYALREQLNAIPDEYSGLDLQVGGEGMKGFYDKILPDYLNNYGKQYGAQVGEIDIVTAPGKSTPQVAAPGIGYFPEPLVEPAQTLRAHSFDITPQMREQIKTKGQPLYSKIGVPGAEATAGAGAATMGSQMFDENNEQSVQNPVHFTENPDAMLLELMQRN